MQLYDFDWVTIAFLVVSIAVLAPLLGKYIALALSGKKNLAVKLGSFGLCFGERYFLKLLNAEKEMTWLEYLKALLFFNFLSAIFLFLILVFQNYLPFNFENLNSVSVDVAFNVTSAFLTNTDWQPYVAEKNLSYFSQMMGLGVHSFLSPATSICAMLVLVRGFILKKASTVGNFWADLFRSIFYILLPLSIILAVFLISQGTPQNFEKPIKFKSLENSETIQVLPQGPAASQIAIKQLGSNGGGFFSTNSAHPYENPSYYSNLAELLAIILLPCAFIFSFGYFIKSRRQAMVLLTVCVVLSIFSILSVFLSEHSVLKEFGHDLIYNGKENRIGFGSSAIWHSLATLTGNGSANSNTESFSPLTLGVFLLNLLNGGVIFGGVGNGLYGLLIYAILGSFVAGLMSGRIPEYLGKKIDVYEIKLSVFVILIPAILVIGGISITLYFDLFNTEASIRGIARVLFAFTSNTINNGILLEGFQNSASSNWILGIVSLLGRFGILIPVVIIGGRLAAKKNYVSGTGSLSTDNIIFIIILVSLILGLGVVTFFPVITIGSILDHALLLQHRFF